MIVDVCCHWGSTPAMPKWNDASTVRRMLHARGITTACLMSSLARRYDLVAGNETVVDVVKAAQDGDCRLRGWLVIHPDQHDEASALMRRHLFSTGLVGAALHPDPVTGDPVTLERYRELLMVFRRYSKALLIHTPDAEAMHYAVEVAAFMNTTKVVASGMGGEQWRSAIDIATRPSNLFLDYAGTLDPTKLEYAIRHMGGVRKIVFGSGAPGTDPAALLAMLDDLGLSADERQRILSGNSKRLFGESTGGGEGEEGMQLTPMGG